MSAPLRKQRKKMQIEHSDQVDIRVSFIYLRNLLQSLCLLFPLSAFAERHEDRAVSAPEAMSASDCAHQKKGKKVFF